MNTSVILLSCISFGTLLLGLFAWQLTSSKPLILNILFASAAFLISAYGISIKHPGQLTFVMPFLVTMLIAGRALGIYWRTFFKGEHDLSVPAHLMGSATAICVVGTYVAFLNQ
jgi:hypothetical protein